MQEHEKVNNLLELARNASEGGNDEEAERYYTQVLEIDPNIAEAWFGKGRSAALQSTLVNIRFHEMLVNFKNAISLSENNKEMLDLCVLEANLKVASLYGIARKHLFEFIEHEKVWSDYISQIAKCIDTLDEIYKWDPQNKTTLENIIFLCKDNIEGVSYRDKFDNNMPKAWCLSPEYEKFLREKFEYSTKLMKDMDPSYEVPTIEIKKPEACFVVTATMGNENNYIVMFLRSFRDEYLKKRKFGMKFISWYYKNGPIFAEFIKNNKILKFISFIFIVIPAFIFAKMLMINNNNRENS